MKHFKAIAAIIGIIIFMAVLISIPAQIKHERFCKCAEENPSDTGIDSCWYHTYNYFLEEGYAAGHYVPKEDQ
jgi:hypothetical protein